MSLKLKKRKKVEGRMYKICGAGVLDNPNLVLSIALNSIMYTTYREKNGKKLETSMKAAETIIP